MDTATRIKKLREKKGITQKALAAKMGVTASWVGMYESGKRQPKPETIKRFADALDVFITDLTGATGPIFESDLEQHAYRLAEKISGTGARIFGEYMDDTYHVWIQYKDGIVLELCPSDVDALEDQIDRDIEHTLNGYRLGKAPVELPTQATVPGYKPAGKDTSNE